MDLDTKEEEEEEEQDDLYYASPKPYRIISRFPNESPLPRLSNGNTLSEVGKKALASKSKGSELWARIPARPVRR
jgi:hypothetical protein